MVVYKNIKSFLDTYPKKLVIFCVANNGVKDMTLNFVKSCKKNEEEIIVFALDKEISKFLEPYCDIVNYFVEVGGNEVYDYDSKKWTILAYYRYFIINDILNTNRIIIYLDTDIVINKNFSYDIINELNNHEVVIQTNGRNCCTGFFAIKPTEKTKNFFTMDFFKPRNYLKINDQELWNAEIFNKNIFKLKLLDISLYPNGKYFYDNYKKIYNTCYLIHFNNIVGYNLKINKMKEHNKWFL